MIVPRVLSIAGSDSGGGAGIQADIRTITMLGGHAMTAITAVTAQNSRGVSAVHVIPTDMVLAQIAAVLDDFGADAIKIGMIGNADTARAVARLLGDRMTGPIVFDPVMVASSGAALADAATIAAFGELMDIATLTTPNLPELAALGGEARVLAHGTALLIKGGHASDAILTDSLVDGSGEVARWSDPRIDTPHTHGTGCTLASAIAVGLAEGRVLADAVDRARRYVRLALECAPDLVPANGPMGHMFVRRDDL